MDYAIKIVEDVLKGERSLWQGHLEDLLYAKRESTVHAYQIRFQRIVELEQALAVLKGKEWAEIEEKQFHTALEEEARIYMDDARRKEMDYLKHSPLFKLIRGDREESE